MRSRMLLIAAVFVALCSGAAAAESTPRRLDEAAWRELLLEHTDDFATARLKHREALEAIAAGNRDLARRLLREATQLDPRFESAHAELAKLDATKAKPSAIGEFYEAIRDHTAGFRNQSLALTNIVLTVDAIIGVMLVWCVLVLLIRYLPYLHHRLARQVLDENHRARRARLLWPAVVAPFLAAASWGLVPLMALSVPVVWIHADRRPRVLLSVLLGLFLVQSVWTRPVETILSGTDPESLVSIVERAAYEPPSDATLAWIERELERRPDDPDLLGAKGLLLARRGDFERSARALLENLAIRPDDAASTNNLAADHFFRGDVERAVAGFQRTVAIDSTRATPYYNLSQAYLQKLFMKEGGAALQQALRRDFAVTDQVERLPRGAVYFMRPRLADSWRLAWREPSGVRPWDLLRGQEFWLGVPTRHLPLWLFAIATLSVLGGFVLPRKKLVFECVNCGSLTCRHCRGEHEGAVLCTECAATARRAKSEVVLTTLLRNRRRDAEAAYYARLRRLDQILPGAGRLVDGIGRRGVVSALLVSAAIVSLWFGRTPLSDPWTPSSDGWLTGLRVVGVLLLALAYFVNNLNRPNPRVRHLQPHPSSSVSLVGLIEGRPARRAKAGAHDA